MVGPAKLREHLNRDAIVVSEELGHVEGRASEGWEEVAAGGHRALVLHRAAESVEGEREKSEGCLT